MEIPAELSLPAVGQGAVGIECRNDDADLIALLAPLNHLETSTRVRAERAMNAKLNGGCQVPIACYAIHQGEEKIWLRGLVGSPDGKQVIRDDLLGDVSNPEALGVELAKKLLEQGAGEILRDVYGDS